MKPSPLQKNEEGSTLSLILTLVILGGIAFAIFWFINQIQDAGGFTEWAQDLGYSTTDGLIGFVSGSISALFTGPKGILTSSKTIWSKSKLSPKNWWPF